MSRDEAPILLPFPIFDRPDYFNSSRPELQLVGIATRSFGADPEAFAKRHGSTEIEIKIGRSDAVAFARMLGKIAYGFAHVSNQLSRLKDKYRLARAILLEPNGLGRFVGTLPAPFQKYPEVQHRMSLRETSDSKLMFAEIQLFASAASPAYAVILGELKNDDHMKPT